MYLYLLRFRKGNIFKIGRSDTYDRVDKLCALLINYEPDLENSLMVTSRNSEVIIALEKQLLRDSREYVVTDDNLKKIDGYTEFRYDVIFDDMLSKIQSEKLTCPHKEIMIQKLIYNLSAVEKNTIDLKEARESAEVFIAQFCSLIHLISDIYFDQSGALTIEFENVCNTKKYHTFSHLIAFPYDLKLYPEVYGGYNILGYCSGSDISRSMMCRFTIDHPINCEHDIDWRVYYKELIWFIKTLFGCLGVSFDYGEYVDVCRENGVRNRKLNECSFLSVDENSILIRNGTY